MEIKRLDLSQVLLPNEKVELKVERKNTKLGFIPMAICYIFFIICLTGDCFFIGALIPMREVMKEKAVNNILLPLSITLTVLHVVPFIFWFVFTLQNKAKNDGKWYVLTNERICIVTASKTLSVVSIFYNQITAMQPMKSAVQISVSEEKILIDGLPSDTFRAKLESILTDDEYQPIVAQPESDGESINEIVGENITSEEEKPSLLESEPQTNEKSEQEENPNGENLTKQIDKILQDFADKVLGDEANDNGENNNEENNKTNKD